MIHYNAYMVPEEVAMPGSINPDEINSYGFKGAKTSYHCRYELIRTEISSKEFSFNVIKQVSVLR